MGISFHWVPFIIPTGSPVPLSAPWSMSPSFLSFVSVHFVLVHSTLGSSCSLGSVCSSFEAPCRVPCSHRALSLSLFCLYPDACARINYWFFSSTAFGMTTWTIYRPCQGLEKLWRTVSKWTTWLQTSRVCPIRIITPSWPVRFTFFWLSCP